VTESQPPVTGWLEFGEEGLLCKLNYSSGWHYKGIDKGAWVTLPGMDWIDIIQWPAMVVTVIAAWLIASQRKFKRNWAFWLFLLSNVLWIVWGWHDRAFALIFLQLCLGFLNVRGAIKNRAGG
jgi:hypothetical protein